MEVDRIINMLEKLTTHVPDLDKLYYKKIIDTPSCSEIQILRFSYDG